MPEFQNGQERKPNGCSCGGVHEVEELPRNPKPKPKKNWLQAATDWRMIAATLSAPAICTFLYYLLPPTKSDLVAVKIEAAANLDIARTEIAGQLRAVHVEVDALKSDVGNLRDDVRLVGRDIKEVLRRSEQPTRQAEVVSEPVKVKASPAVPPPPPHRARKVEKKDAGLASWFR